MENNLFLENIWQTGEVREIRIASREGRISSGYFNDPTLAAKAIEKYENGNFVYVTLNPVHQGLMARRGNKITQIRSEKEATTSDKDIPKIVYCLVDVDSVRPSGISATDTEKASSKIIAEKIISEIGQPLVYGDSGNGYHLIYKSNAQNPNETKAFLVELQKRFGTASVGVDLKVFNPARITKVLGTWAIKGENTDDRPWRKSAVISIDRASQTLDLAAQAVPQPAKPIQKTLCLSQPAASGTREPFDVRKFLSDNGVIVKQEKQWNDATMLVLDACVFDPSHKGGESSVIVHPDGKLTYQCFHDSCSGKTWHDLRDAVGAPKEKKQCTCKTCGKAIEWTKDGEKWIPMEDATTRHFCNTRKTREHKANNFVAVATEEIFGGMEPEPEKEEKKSNVGFDIKKWHPIYQNYLSQISNKTDAPDQFICQAFTTALAATIGNRVFLKIGLRVYPNLYSMIVAPSTEFRKTTSMNLGVIPVKEINSSKKRSYKQQYDLYKEKLESCGKEKPEPPAKSFSIYPEEITPEGLLKNMKDKPDGLFFFSEIGTFLSMMEKNYGKGLKEMLTSMYDVPPEYSRETLSGGEIIVERPAPSLIAATTSEWLQKHVSEADMFSGFLARFQVCVLRDTTKQPVAIPDFVEIDPQWVRFFESLEQFQHSYEISEEAKELYTIWFENHRARLSQEDSFLKAFLLRLETVVHKYAIIYQAIDDCDAGIKSKYISANSYSYSLAKAKWDIDNITSCYTELISPPDYTQQRILEILKKYSDESGRMCKRDLAKKAHLRVKEFDEIVGTLKMKGYLVEEQKGKYTYFRIAK